MVQHPLAFCLQPVAEETVAPEAPEPLVRVGTMEARVATPGRLMVARLVGEAMVTMRTVKATGRNLSAAEAVEAEALQLMAITVMVELVELVAGKAIAGAAIYLCTARQAEAQAAKAA